MIGESALPSQAQYDTDRRGLLTLCVELAPPISGQSCQSLGGWSTPLARPRRAAWRIGTASGGAFRIVLEAFDARIEQFVQSCDALRSEPFVECCLCLLPSALSFGSFRVSGLGRFDETAARIVSGADIQQSLIHERLHVACQCRRIHLHALGQVARANGAQPDDV